MLQTFTISSSPAQIVPEIHVHSKPVETISQIKLLCCHCLNGEDYKDRETNTNLRRCQGCKSVWYCSKECQSSAWKTHKLICQSPEKKDRGLTLDQWKTICGISTFYREGQPYRFPKIPKDNAFVCKFYNGEKDTIKDLTQKKFKKMKPGSNLS